jgi:beta-glucanase (GH16 family)
MADFPSLTTIVAKGRALLGAAALATGLAALLATLPGDAAAEQRHPISHVGFLTQFGTDNGKFDAARWWIAHNISNNSPQHNIGWQRDAVRHLTDRIELSILDRPYRDRDYSAGAVKTYGRHGFGRFDVIMQPQFAPGAISAFFVYTGPAFLTRHDEIDFEFTGRNPTQVDINTYVDGRNSRLEPIDLGFRYDEAPHAYAFEWTPDSVRWFVDGKQIAEVTGDIVPQVPGKITSSIWAGKGLIRWAGKFDPASLPLKSDVFCMSWRSFKEPGETCTDRFLADPDAWAARAGAGTQ